MDDKSNQNFQSLFNVEEILKQIILNLSINFGYRHINKIYDNTFHAGDIFYRRNHFIFITNTSIDEYAHEIKYQALRLNLGDMSLNLEETTENWCEISCNFHDEDEQEKLKEPLNKEPYIWLGNIKFISEYNFDNYLHPDTLKTIFGFVKVLTQFIKNGWLGNVTNHKPLNYQIKFQPKICWIDYCNLGATIQEILLSHENKELKLQNFELYYDPELDMFGVVICTNNAMGYWAHFVVHFSMEHHRIGCSLLSKHEDRKVFSLGTISIIDDSGTALNDERLLRITCSLVNNLEYVPWLLQAFNLQALVAGTIVEDENKLHNWLEVGFNK